MTSLDKRRCPQCGSSRIVFRDNRVYDNLEEIHTEYECLNCGCIYTNVYNFTPKRQVIKHKGKYLQTQLTHIY